MIHQADSPNSTNVFPHQTGVLTSINLDFPKEGSSYEIGKKLLVYFSNFIITYVCIENVGIVAPPYDDVTEKKSDVQGFKG